MIQLSPHPRDDAHFLSKVLHIIEDSACASLVPDVFIVQIDNWFGPRWLDFSGKTLGALGLRMKQLTIPPFHPSRVLSQQRFSLPTESRDYRLTETMRVLHRRMPSQRNLRRRIADFACPAMFVWYSGNTAKNKSGSLMIYSVFPDETESWYLGFERDGSWIVKKRVGVPPGVQV